MNEKQIQEKVDFDSLVKLVNLHGEDYEISAFERLQAELAAERARRIKAEEVVDAAILMPFELKRMDETPVSHELAEAYRAQYPRVEKETK